MTTADRLRTIDDLLDVDGLSYGIVQPGAPTAGGIPMLRVVDLSDGADPDDVMRVKPEIEAKFRRSRLAGGELLLTVVGSPGLARVATPDMAGYNVARAIAVLRLRSIEPEWVALAFKTPMVRHQLASLLNTTVQATLNLADVRTILIPVPENQLRRGILRFFEALDDRIAANRRVASSADTLRAALWERLTDGTLQVPLSSIARFVNGRAFTKDATGTGKVVIRIAELNSGIGDSTVYNDIDVAEDHLARPGDLLMGWSGSLTTARWYRDEAIVNQHIFKVIPYATNPLWAVACAVETKMMEFKMIAATKATTMGHIQRRHLDEPVYWPELSGSDRDLGRNLWTRALLAERESEQLVATRDELLPLLMNGSITVRDAEKVVEQI